MLDEDMTDHTTAPHAPQGNDAKLGPVARFIRDTELDTRMLGMVGALLLIWTGFHLYGTFFNGGGVFLTESAQSIRHALLTRKALSGTGAIRKERVYLLSESLLQTPATRLAAAVYLATNGSTKMRIKLACSERRSELLE